MSKAIKFNGEEYLKIINGKRNYVWDSNSEYGNLIPVRVIAEGEYTDKGMLRPISAVLVIHKIKTESDVLYRNMIALDHTMSLEQVLKKINNIVEYSINESKRYHKDIKEAIEAHLVPTEFYEDKLNYNFFLSEIFNENNKELGQIIELMRAAEHIKHITTILLLIPKDDITNEEQEIYYEGLTIFTFNLAASQLRETLKLLDKFMKSDFFQNIKEYFDDRGQKAINYLEIAIDFKDEDGLLKKILKPLRDATFHYDFSKAQEWGKMRMERETQEKPPISNLVLSDQITNTYLGPGADLDNSLYQEHWVFGRDGLFEAQQEIIQCQQNFIYFVRALCEILMEHAKINSERPFDFFQQYRYGYKV